MAARREREREKRHDISFKGVPSVIHFLHLGPTS
jgi:hypothetical protein